MKRSAFLLAAALLALGSCSNPSGKQQGDYPDPPIAPRKDTTLTAHGHQRVDSWYWLNQRENPEVLNYLKAENEYVENVMADTRSIQDSLYKELVSRIKQNDETVPFPENNYLYYNRFLTGKEYPVYCRKMKNPGAPEEILLDVNEMAKGFSYYSVSGVWVSPDNSLLACGIDTVSRRKYEIRFLDLRSGKWLADRIPETTGSVAWANDNKTCFYTRKNTTTLRSEKIYRHTLGTSSIQDPLVYHETDETYSVDVSRTKSGEFIQIDCGSTLSTEVRLLDADKPMADFRILINREKDHEYQAEPFGDSLFIRTNQDARNFRIVKASIENPGKENWVEVISHKPEVFIEGFEVFNDFLAVQERSNGLTQIRIFDRASAEQHLIDFGEETYSASLSTNKEMDTKMVRFTFSSLTTPFSTFDYDIASRTKSLLKQNEVPGGFNPADYQSERLFAVADDGTRIPVSLVYRKGFKKDGSHPLLLYGYGSYGASMSASFSPDRLSLLNRGFVFAIAHIRGGQEMGRSWYEDGKLLKKKNTFSDFIDVAEFLIQEKYAASDKVCAMGGSAGGLLIGAVVNMAPALFRAVVAQVPFVDVVTTMLDSTIPLTTSEYDEWGNPNIREYYDYMLSYSPYDQVMAADYPAMLVTTGLHDSQVQYFEPAKWVSKLRTLKTDNNIILFKINMEAGHGGASGRFQRYHETALTYTFLMNQTGVQL